jgi:hypothetical protein
MMMMRRRKRKRKELLLLLPAALVGLIGHSVPVAVAAGVFVVVLVEWATLLFVCLSMNEVWYNVNNGFRSTPDRVESG